MARSRPSATQWATVEPVGPPGHFAPVLAGLALGPAYSDVGLQFIVNKYGDAKAHVAAVALAPYFGPSSDDETSSLESLFGAVTTSIDGMDATFATFANLGKEYGIPIVAYGGGQSLAGASEGALITNIPLKRLAQHDVRMYSAYTRYLALWKKNFGPALFMHSGLTSGPAEPTSSETNLYDTWGAIQSVRTDLATCGANLPMLVGTEPLASVVASCPKYRALVEQVPGN